VVLVEVACGLACGGEFAAPPKTTPRPPLGGLAVSLAGIGLREIEDQVRILNRIQLK
jgi:hypothetical protein